MREDRDNTRRAPLVVDLEKLEKQAEELFLHRFLAAIQKARGDHGRYLTLRAGDQVAIEAASDGSEGQLLQIVRSDGL
ncbi:MAG: hypothetical protein ACRDLB_01325 [Actinomycetota bacterium]